MRLECLTLLIFIVRDAYFIKKLNIIATPIEKKQIKKISGGFEFCSSNKRKMKNAQISSRIALAIALCTVRALHSMRFLIFHSYQSTKSIIIITTKPAIALHVPR